MTTSNRQEQPTAFLCHASDDSELAVRIAHGLQASGVATFYAPWEMAAGESLRQRIEQGIEGCTHFVVLLTPASITKPWVNLELDGAFERKLAGRCRLVPIRYGLPVEQLSLFLRSMHCPPLTDANYDDDLRNLIGDIYGISHKPPLGSAPDFVKRPATQSSGLSLGAEKIAQMLVTKSERGRPGVAVEVEDILKETSLTEAELEIAVDELESLSMVQPVHAIGCALGYFAVEPKVLLFIRCDPLFMDWSPREDALTLAAELLNRGGWINLYQFSEETGWPARRINPAVAQLLRMGAVLGGQDVDPWFVHHQIRKNNRTARYLRDRQ